ncbi:hypothetical protein Tco_1255350, partial [Tanacetum coccineum]
KIDVDRSGDTSGLERQFKRIYIFLGALKDGFRTGQRDCLRLDSYFLPVKDETKESWKWFLDSLCDDLDLFRNSNFTFITDTLIGKRFKVNPIDGPNMWPKSNLPGILTPPKYTPQPGQRSTNVGSQPTSYTGKKQVILRIKRVRRLQVVLSLQVLLSLHKLQQLDMSGFYGCRLDGFSHSGDALSFPLNYKPVRYQENGLDFSHWVLPDKVFLRRWDLVKKATLAIPLV